MTFSDRLLHTYVAEHGGMFDAPEKQALRAFLGVKRGAAQGEVEEELGLGDDELRVLENALT
jgi:hypothetical protein